MPVPDESFRYAGWFTLDLRVLVTLVVFSAALAVLVLALRFRGRRWHDYVVGFFALFGIAFVVTLTATNLLLTRPALRIETIFPAP